MEQEIIKCINTLSNGQASFQESFIALVVVMTYWLFTFGTLMVRLLMDVYGFVVELMSRQ